MQDSRPDPDRLLADIKKADERDSQGKLKIFFGACPGVGKTFAMLTAALQRQAEGTVVGLGTIERHDRPELRSLLDALPRLPGRLIDDRGKTCSELDLDGALSSGMQLILIDELAHSNPPDARHAKRWQDVEELLQAGIDVYTTLNVQHLQGMNDIVAGILGVPIREIVPDRVFDDATDVVLIDLPPDDLLARLENGQLNLPVSLERARQNFFRRGNLIALRELALRRVADRVNTDVNSYRQSKSIRTVWPTRDRLMVCVRADPSEKTLLREGAALAHQLKTDWIAAHIDRLHIDQDRPSREILLELATSAENLGAEFANIPGEDVAATLIDYAAKRNITKLILGHDAARRKHAWKPSLLERMEQGRTGMSILLIGRAGRKSYLKASRRWAARGEGLTLSLFLATLISALTTVVAGWLLQVFALSNVVMLFLLSVVFVALRFGRVAGIWASILSVGSFDFFFVEPRLSFAVSDTQYIFTFTLMLAVALATSQLGARLRSEAKIATSGERRASAIARVARDLSAAIKVEEIAAICSNTIAPLFSARIALILPDESNHLHAAPNALFVDISVAQWVFDHLRPAGQGTQTLSKASSLYLPLKAPIQAQGVFVVSPTSGTLAGDPDDRRLLDACCSSIALALERIRFVEIAQATLVRMEGEKLRNTLLAAVSHDLRTPLTAIRGMAETLEYGVDLAASEHRDIAHAIRLQAEALQRLMTNLLDLARMQSEGVRLNKEWHAIDEIVGSALRHIGPALKDHRVKTALPMDLPLIAVDPVLIERVLANLLDNAGKYTPPGSTIVVGATCLNDAIHLYVEDDGPGLPSLEPERLFEPFARGQKESSIAGVGLGLALSRSVVKAHDGVIRAEQRRPHGARFEIQLPRGSPPEIEREVIE